MASTAALSAAAQDRKSRLAQLKSLKRKQEALQDEGNEDSGAAGEANPQQPNESNGMSKYISGRNYDFETKGAKLGFEAAPSDGKETLEKQASILEEEAKRQAEQEELEDKPLDLFKLQPRKPNWDLKRDLDRKLEILNVRTDNAIARLVRERIARQQAAIAIATGNTGGEVEAAGMEGTTLVEATNVREREDEEEARREREQEDALLDVSRSF